LHEVQLAFTATAAFLESDDGGRRGHSKKLYKKRCQLDINVRRYTTTFSNSLSDRCVNCTTENTSQKHRAKQLELGTQYCA